MEMEKTTIYIGEVIKNVMVEKLVTKAELARRLRVSRIYFKPDRILTGRLRQNMDFFRYPLSKYFPHEMLRPETLERERVQTTNKPEDETKNIDTVTG